MGALAFAQVSKTETINKEAGRKVLNDDMKNVSTDTESDAKKDGIKGSVTQKGREGIKMTSENQLQDVHKVTGNKNDFIKVTNQEANGIKWSSTEKGKKSNSESDNANFLKVTDSKSENAHYKMTLKTGGKNSASETQSNDAIKVTMEKADMDATAKSIKASDPYLKISSAKKE